MDYRRSKPMSATNPTGSWWTELLTRIDAKDASGFLEFLTDNAEFRFGSAPTVSERSAIGAQVAQFFDLIAKSRHALIRTWEDEEVRACQGEVTYTRLDGTVVTLPFVNILEMDGDKIRRYLIYADLAPLFDQGGQSESV